MTTPLTVSRDFLVRQAVLNWLAHTYPVSVSFDGPAKVCRSVINILGLSVFDHAGITREFSRLTEQYREAA